MYDITEIKNYILFLKSRCGLFVTLHPLKKESVIVPSELITFNIHDNSYCIYVKSHPDAQKHCMEKQKQVFEACRKNGAYCGTCHAGVIEYIYPIRDGTQEIGFVSVSGYRAENAESYLQATAKKYYIPYENLRRAYSSLHEKHPERKELDALILPLCRMLELAYIKNEAEGKGEEQWIDRVVRYVKRHHTQPIVTEDVCRAFSCSRSHVSHAFKKHTGKSFREFLTEIRIEDAKSLLRYSRLSVTEVALSVGFGDSNYFSNVFKKQTGMSPMAYRSAYREAE